ncbi:DNA/RNA nuclease SfsA [Exiguobacterium aquaticum]|uniref:DNA/RNA nuclease SfsA n=1 Tax=Exiguobacterium TaxID=33986 RepID=UPI001BE95A4B|nr:MULTISPECIES: DNA/RNA nuclease SfsA [Exiguobacterium]MCT4776266.1 DNA/RNA nuclease SfsA [Exiguobacterium aquaticum]MCT4788553.1 DNA/RNA nuclease SfsA [Exiguobacterium mexicanum]
MYRFTQPLQEGVIVNRRNRFVMDVLLGDTVVACHCPVTGRIGDLVFDGVPCLISTTNDSRRNTTFTVEAISIDADEQWIGIHQGRANDFVAYCLDTGALPVFPYSKHVEREQVIGTSRLDFKVDGVYMEVKAPLTELFVTPLPRFERRAVTRPVETERLIRHLETLIATLPETKRAVLLYVFLYDAPVFTGNPNRKQDARIRQLIRDAIADGLEIWQLNCRFTAEGIVPLHCAETTSHFK